MVAEDSLDSFKIDSLNPNPNLKDAVFLLDKVKSIILPIDHTLVEYESLKSQVASLNETLSHTTENLAKAVSDLESATLQMNSMENQHATLVNELEMKLSQSQTALTEYNATKNKVVASLQQSKEEVQSLRRIIEKQNLEISAKNVVIIHQDADLAALQSSNLSLLTMLKSQEATGHDLERVLSNKETEIQRINKEKEEALMANASINGELEAVKGKINALQSDHELTKV
ncbi:hypothetical protein BKA69DRAFT_734310 [Paraphysoderma sedebokerense]|nr:hypothetical protein BKA69DRAFT_734310 [Paraphysoderma sedebokerense]